MIRRIVLENYMAHIRTVIEPANGLTVLIGPNNCGKSALIHALEMVCYNSDAADFAIRHGAKKATVTIETEDEDGTAHTITWWRKEKTAGYIIDGREISGQGRSKTPDDLHDYLRMPMIESAAGGKEFLLHFGLQKSPIFLLDDPPSRAAQFFASATDADKLMQMQKTHQMKTLHAKRDKERLDGELAQLDRQLETLAPLPSLSERLTDLEDEHLRLSELGTQIGAMFQLVHGLELQNRTAAHNTQTVGALVKLEKPPAVSDVSLLRHTCDELENVSRRGAMEQKRAGVVGTLRAPSEPNDTPAMREIVAKLTGGQRALARCEARQAVLAPFAAPPPLHEVSRLADFLNELRALSAELNRHEAESSVLKPLRASPALDDAKSLRHTIVGLSHATDRAKSQSSKASVLSPLTAPSEPADSGPLTQTIARMAVAARDVASNRETLRLLNGQIEGFKRELDQWVELNPRCAACGQLVSAELIMDGGHWHE